MPSADRDASTAAFATQGLVFISLTTRLNRFQDLWGFSELGLSMVLLGMVLLAGVGSVVAERLAPRRESAAPLRAGLGLAAYGVALGMIDAAANMKAVALEHSPTTW